MAKAKVKFVCSSCGALSLSWAGKCFQCGEWNTLSEQVDLSGQSSIATGRPLNPSKVSITSNHKSESRMTSDIDELDQVLGGGFVAGSVNLIAGQPGIGKSTLLLQIANNIAKKVPVLFVSGEESEHQVVLRAKRLGVKATKLDIVSSNSTDDIVSTINSSNYKLVIVDSIQAVSTSIIGSSSGSVSQISGSTQLLTTSAKVSNTILIIVGHVTKQGSIAGPKVLEHVVDVVLEMEGERYGGLRLLRGTKNRYGSTNETGIFEMNDSGLSAVKNPSAALLSERQVSDGSVVLATMEGTRAILVEVQALISPSNFGYPKRASSGFDMNRLSLLIAVLQRRSKLNLSESDVYVNIVGGLKVSEPAADLAVCMALASAEKGMALKKDAVVFGEVGLSGEVRRVPFSEKRISEAKKLGFVGAICPDEKTSTKSGLFVVSSVRDALNQFLEKD